MMRGTIAPRTGDVVALWISPKSSASARELAAAFTIPGGIAIQAGATADFASGNDPTAILAAPGTIAAISVHEFKVPTPRMPSEVGTEVNNTLRRL